MVAIERSSRMYVRTLAIAMAVAVGGLPALAQTVPHAAATRRAIRPGARLTVPAPSRAFRPLKIGPHTFYGAIASVSGNTVVIRTRRRRLVTVDATTVFADGTYSAPLFVGKLVTVDGDDAASGVFTAAHISRMTNLNGLPNDR
jgi:hypothetical protein